MKKELGASAREKLLIYPWEDFTEEAVSHLVLKGRGKARWVKEPFTLIPPNGSSRSLAKEAGQLLYLHFIHEPGAEHVRACCPWALGCKEKGSGPRTQAPTPNPLLFLPCLPVSLSNMDDHEFSPGRGQVFLIFSVKMSRATQFI